MTPQSQTAIQIIIAKMILPRMQEKQISVYALAKLTGISRATLGRWLKGTNEITLSKFIDILTALEINPHFVTKEGDDLEYNNRINFN